MVVKEHKEARYMRKGEGKWKYRRKKESREKMKERRIDSIRDAFPMRIMRIPHLVHHQGLSTFEHNFDI